MSWYPAARREMNEVLGFLRVREWSCVSFTARLLSHDAGSNRVFVNRAPSATDRISESLLLSNHGLILPVLASEPAAPELYRQELLPLLAAYAHNVHSVMGIEGQVRAIEEILPASASERIEYYLMTKEYFNIERPMTPKLPLTIRQASPSDVRALFPLQRDYEREEVLLDPERFNPTASFLSLQKTLRKEIVFVAEVDGIPVAKAGTNARGMNYYQIGGVYTVPSLRGLGIGRSIMQALLWEIAQEKKHLCLFVKKANPAAIKLYRNLGFTSRDSYSISYYRL